MRAKICIQAALVGAFVWGGPGLPATDLMGVSVAEAKDYYTRKRVNGRWVTGRFPKQNSTAAKSSPRDERREVAESVPTSPTLPPAAQQPLPVSRPGPVVDPAAQAQQNSLLPLQRALEQRARSMAAQQPGTTSSVRSVTYDFDKGRKTIIYLDGTVAEEALEPVATGQVNVQQ